MGGGGWYVSPKCVLTKANKEHVSHFISRLESFIRVTARGEVRTRRGGKDCKSRQGEEGN